MREIETDTEKYRETERDRETAGERHIHRHTQTLSVCHRDRESRRKALLE